MNTDGCTENSTKFSIKGTKDKKKSIIIAQFICEVIILMK